MRASLRRDAGITALARRYRFYAVTRDVREPACSMAENKWSVGSARTDNTTIPSGRQSDDCDARADGVRLPHRLDNQGRIRAFEAK